MIEPHLNTFPSESPVQASEPAEHAQPQNNLHAAVDFHRQKYRNEQNPVGKKNWKGAEQHLAEEYDTKCNIWGKREATCEKEASGKDDDGCRPVVGLAHSFNIGNIGFWRCPDAACEVVVT